MSGISMDITSASNSVLAVGESIKFSNKRDLCILTYNRHETGAVFSCNECFTFRTWLGLAKEIYLFLIGDPYSYVTE